MAAVELILLQRVEKLGQMGEIVKVKPGFARNFLLPQKKALRATADNRKYFDNQKAQLEAQNLRRKEEAERVAERVAGLSVVIIRQAGESGSVCVIVGTQKSNEAKLVRAFRHEADRERCREVGCEGQGMAIQYDFVCREWLDKIDLRPVTVEANDRGRGRIETL